MATVSEPSAVYIHEVSKIYDGKDVALTGISFSLDPGKVTAVIGKSGSGKTTLLRVLNGLVEADSGEVRVLGETLSDLNKKQLRNLRKKIGFIFQQFGLVPRLSAIENVLMGSLGSLKFPRLGVRTYPIALRREAYSILQRVGIGGLAFRRVDSLSGGEQQRVAIARALIQKPDLLLADEPVASLDPTSSKEVLELIGKICHEDGLTALVSLHQFEFVKDFSERVLALRNGELIFDDMTSNLDESTVTRVYQSTSTNLR